MKLVDYRRIPLRLILTVSLLMANALTCVGANASEPGQITPEQAARMEQRAIELKERLELSDEQVEEITPIIRDHMQKSGEILKGYGIDPVSGERPEERLNFREARKMRGELEDVRGQTKSRLATILSPEQMREYESIVEERRQEIRARIMDSR